MERKVLFQEVKVEEEYEFDGERFRKLNHYDAVALTGRYEGRILHNVSHTCEVKRVA